MTKSQRDAFKRVVQIAHEHILFARRNPDKLTEVAKQMGITNDAAIAAAIADQVVEEYRLTLIGGTLCIKH